MKIMPQLIDIMAQRAVGVEVLLHIEAITIYFWGETLSHSCQELDENIDTTVTFEGFI